MADERARGLFVSIRPINGETKFSPTPPAPPPVGPALLCPYVLTNGSLGNAELFTSFSESDSVHTATVESPGAAAAAGTSTTPEDKQTWADATAAGTGKVGITLPTSGTDIIAFECVIDSLSVPMTGLLSCRLGVEGWNILDAGANSYDRVRVNNTLYPYYVSDAPEATVEREAFNITNGANIAQNFFKLSAATTASLPVRLGAYYNQVTKQLGFVDSVIGDHGYFTYPDGTYAGQSPFEIYPDVDGLLVEYSMQLSSGYLAGDTVSGRLFTKASNYELPYPATTVDPCLTAASNVLTAYPLDASEAEIQSVGIDERLLLTLAQQRGEFTTNATVGSIYEAFALPAGFTTGTADTMNLTTGSIAFEFEYSLPTHNSGISGGVSVLENEFRLTTPAFSNWLEFRFRLMGDGSYRRSIEVGGQSVPSVVGLATARVGVLIDNAAGELLVWVDGVLEATIQWSSPPPAELLAGMNAKQTVDWDGTAGLVVKNRLITDPYWFTTPFPPGSVDINGKAV